jgi:hypothetical protein
MLIIILPFTECDKSQDFWRVYCGGVSPGEFVSRCKTNCVQLRLRSRIRFENEPPVSGMNVTVEPTRKSKCLFNVDDDKSLDQTRMRVD